MNIPNYYNAICVEVLVKNTCTRVEHIEAETKEKIQNILKNSPEPLGTTIFIKKELHGKDIENLIEAISVEVPISINSINRKIQDVFTDAESASNIVFTYYRPNQRCVEIETLESDCEEIDASNHWLLPSRSFVNLWENLIYEDGLKDKILNYALSSLIFSQHNVNHHIISCNRLILLHGPPGTGKTSLCKAIAQKLSIRLHSLFKFTHLIEINSHSLFSKWFSESGKLVMKLFAKIREIISQQDSLVCILMDEVESISYARDEMSGQEPKDAMRVVNALLTQLDSIKEYPNVLVLATSNLAKTIDLAFIDRADIKQHIGLPSSQAISKIYLSMFQELARSGIIEPFLEPIDMNKLTNLSELSVGLSGRTLRKLPFIAHALLLCSHGNSTTAITLDVFLNFLLKAVQQHYADRECI